MLVACHSMAAGGDLLAEITPRTSSKTLLVDSCARCIQHVKGTVSCFALGAPLLAHVRSHAADRKLEASTFCEMPQVYDWDFNVFELDRLSGRRPLFAVTMALLDEQGLLVGVPQPPFLSAYASAPVGSAFTDQQCRHYIHQLGKSWA